MSNKNWTKKACGVLLLWAMTAVALPAQTREAATPNATFTVLYTFDGADGAIPIGGLLQGTGGELYGTASFGGGTSGEGAVFKITPGGSLTTLYNFCPQGGRSCPDGAVPKAKMVQGSDGNFYGTTAGGGAHNVGTIFKITPSGALTTLHSFDGADGSDPQGLVQGTDGNFYGTAILGGRGHGPLCFGKEDLRCGTVFKITPGGVFKTLYSFCSQGGNKCTDGADPDAELVQGADGNFYGITVNGGADGCGSGCGTVFKITPGGGLTMLHDFDETDGQYPVGALAQGTDGNFYGTTSYGGTDGDGTIYKITPDGVLTTLYNFDFFTDDGPGYGGLVQGSDGNFYGTTSGGGANNQGTVFSITAGGTLVTLYSFCSQSNCADGYQPLAGLAQDTDGNFYGTVQYGGIPCPYNGDGCGTVFSLSIGLVPFVETNPAIGAVGAAVKILGTDLTGATSVTFNGTPATFTVKLRSEITTTVPAGATTGTVEVVTPGRTLLSNVPFRVD